MLSAVHISGSTSSWSNVAMNRTNNSNGPGQRPVSGSYTREQNSRE